MHNFKKVLFFALAFTILCTACGKNTTDIGFGSNSKSKKIEIHTEYFPVDYADGVAIVQRSEDVELFGVINDKGKVVVEPEYDEMRFTVMDGQYYIKAVLEGKKGIIGLDGTICIPLEYDEVVSAGTIGWVAEKDKNQKLLSPDGKILQELSRRYYMVFADKYLITSPYFDLSDSDNEIQFEFSMYNLKEELIKENYDTEYRLWSLGYEDLFLCYENNYLNLVDEKGNVIDKVNNMSGIILFPLISIDEDKHKIIFEMKGSSEEGVLFSGAEYGVYELDIDTKEYTLLSEKTDKLICHNQLNVVMNGEFYRIYDLKGNDITGERYVDYQGEDECVFLKNTDGQYGLIDTAGKEIIPFGEISSSNKSLRDSIYKDHKAIDIFENKGVISLAAQDDTDGYVIYVFNLDE